MILVILNDYHVSFDAGGAAAARTAARRLVERLSPYDLASVITTSGTRAAQAEFTSNKARLLAAVDKFFPQSEVRATGVAEGRGGAGTNARFGFIQDIKARRAMDAMSNAARTLALIPGRRKAVLLVSQGLPLSLEEMITNPTPAARSRGCAISS
jgi:hypothetical protein